MRSICLLVALCLAFTTSRASGAKEAEDYLKKAYPPAEAGMVRYAIILPPQENEDLFKVEVIVGKTTTVDSANRANYTGSIKEVNIDGWGFTRLVVKDMGKIMSTLVGGGKPEERFVTVPSIIVRYNSRLPIAVYVPDGAEVRYRIWSTTPGSIEMPKR